MMNIRSKYLLWVWFSQLWYWHTLYAQEINPSKVNIILGLTETVTLDFTPDARLSIGNDSLISVEIHPEKRRLIFKGLKAGNTDCTVFDLAGEVKAKFLIYITATDQSNLLQRLNEFLGDIEGLEIGLKGGKVFLGGEIIVPSDIGRITTILESMKDNVLNLVELSPHTQLIVAQKMQTEIHDQGMPNVTVRVVNSLFWLQGVVEDPKYADKALKIAETYLPPSLEKLARFSNRFSKVGGVKLIRNFITVQEVAKKPPEIPKLIKITVQFVELSKDYLKTFGFTWSPTMVTGGAIKFGRDTNNSVVTGGQGVLSGSITNLFPKLASAKSAGHARTVQSGMLLIEDKTKGVLTKGQSVPYTVGTGEFSKGVAAEGGFSMTVTPTILTDEKIKLELGISVRKLTGNVAAPTKLENSISTSVIVKSDDSAAIGGVVMKDINVDYDRDPPGGVKEATLGDNPRPDNQASSIFSFIRSKNFTTNKNQFVMFVTPKIIESASVGTEELKKKFRQRSR